MNKAISLILLFVLIPTTHLSHVFANQIETKNAIEKNVKFNLPSSDIVKAVSIGYDNFLADLLWLQFIQYNGSSFTNNAVLPETFSLVDTITSLDPYFVDAYTYGAYALTDNKEFDKAIIILDKGMKNNPKDWYLPYQMGFLYYINKKNKVMAAKYLNQAGDVEGAPITPKRLAALMILKTSADIDIKIGLWQSVYEKSKQEKDKVNEEKAFRKLVEFKIEKDKKFLEDLIEKYNSNNVNDATIYQDLIKKGENTITSENTYTKKLTEFKNLVEKGYIKSLPIDPLGRPYMLDSETYEVKSFPLPWNS